MSPKDHKHPEWERKWRDTMADHQSAPATEEDWLSMSALLNGGGAAPPDPTPAPGAGGGVSWSTLKWLLPVLMTTTLATVLWVSTVEKEPEAVEELEANLPPVVGAKAEPPATKVSTALLSPDDLPASQQTPGVTTQSAGSPAGPSRRDVGGDRASGVRANPPVGTEQPKQKASEFPPVQDGSGAVAAADSVKDADVEREASSNLPELTSGSDVTASQSPEAEPQSFRSIPRLMPTIPREYDPDTLWKKKIERQIANLSAKPKRPPKTENGLYPRVRVRY